MSRTVLYWQILRRAGNRYSEIDAEQRAAAFSYYAFFSMFPLVLVLITVGSLFVDRETVIKEVMQLLGAYLPSAREKDNLIVQTIDGIVRTRGGVGVVAFAMLVWSALRFLKVLIRSTNRAWRANTYNWWQLPLRSLALLGIVAGASLLGILAPTVARLLKDWLTPVLGYFTGLFDIAVALIPRLVMFCGLALLYKLAPSRRTRFGEVWVAALAVTLLLWLAETLFVIYVRDFARFNALYGSLGGIVAFLMWIYVSGLSFVLGACLCAAQAEQRAENPESHEPENQWAHRS